MTRNVFTAAALFCTLLLLASALPGCGGSSTAAAQNTPPRYKITDLGTSLAGEWAEAKGINTAGDVAGSTLSGFNEARPFVYRGATKQELSGFAAGPSSHANGVNDQGQVVGVSGASAFFWQRANGVTELAGLGGAHSLASDINAQGQIAGWSEEPALGVRRATLWPSRDAPAVDLGTLPSDASSEAYAVNKNGQVVGASFSAPSGNFVLERAFLWSNGVMTALGGSGGIAYDINDRGQVVGYSYTDQGFQPFLWQNGTMTNLGDLGIPNAEAHGVNNRGEVVGCSWLPGRPERNETLAEHAFLWRNGKMYDLNDLVPPDSGWTLVSADKINDQGQIIGYGYRTVSPGISTNAPFLLTPEP